MWEAKLPREPEYDLKIKSFEFAFSISTYERGEGLLYEYDVFMYVADNFLIEKSSFFYVHRVMIPLNIMQYCVWSGLKFFLIRNVTYPVLTIRETMPIWSLRIYRTSRVITITFFVYYNTPYTYYKSSLVYSLRFIMY